MAKINNDIYTVTIPKFGKTPKISVANAEKAAFPAKKLTVMGGEFPEWAGNSKDVHWSLGASHFIYNIPAAEAYADSVATAKKETEKLKEKEEDKEDDDKKRKKRIRKKKKGTQQKN